MIIIVVIIIGDTNQRQKGYKPASKSLLQSTLQPRGRNKLRKIFFFLNVPWANLWWHCWRCWWERGRGWWGVPFDQEQCRGVSGKISMKQPKTYQQWWQYWQAWQCWGVSGNRSTKRRGIVIVMKTIMIWIISVILTFMGMLINFTRMMMIFITIMFIVIRECI